MSHRGSWPRPCRLVARPRAPDRRLRLVPDDHRDPARDCRLQDGRGRTRAVREAGREGQRTERGDGRRIIDSVRAGRSSTLISNRTADQNRGTDGGHRRIDGVTASRHELALSKESLARRLIDAVADLSESRSKAPRAGGESCLHRRPQQRLAHKPLGRLVDIVGPHRLTCQLEHPCDGRGHRRSNSTDLSLTRQASAAIVVCFESQ